MPDNFIPRRHKSLTAVLHQLVLDHDLDARTIARLVGYKSYQTMMSELSRQPLHKLGADKILPMIDVMDSDYPVEWLAEQRSGVFVRLPKVTGSLKSAEQQCFRTIKEFADVVQTVGQALADGKVNPDELAKTRKETWESIQAHLMLLKIIELECGEAE
ncbi:transcriptional regulator [Desulfovibrio sp. OttesenSCG-928-G11]|nr:transcriptional regulator [Desulfovibrio sp. OttesenSCG-928-G11]